MNRPADNSAVTAWGDAKSLALAASIAHDADAQAPEPGEDAGFQLLAARCVLDRAMPLTRDVVAVCDDTPPPAVARLAQSGPRLLSTLELFADALPDKARKRTRKAVARVNHRVQQAARLDRQIAELEQHLEGDVAQRHRAGAQRLHLRLTQARLRLQTQLTLAADKAVKSKAIDRLVEKLKQEVVEAQVVAIHPRTDACFQQGWRDIGRAIEDVIAHEPHIAEADAAEAHAAFACDLLQLRHLAEAYAMLYPGSLRDALATLSELQAGAEALQLADHWLMRTLPAFIKKEEQRTIDYFGYARGYARLRSGARALSEHQQTRQINLHEQLQTHWRRLKDDGFWSALREQLLSPLHR